MIDLHDANHAISFNRYVRVFLIVGLVALALSLLGAVFTPQQHKHTFLSVPFFLIRAAVYFFSWIVFAVLLNRWSREQDESGEPRTAWWLEHISGPGSVR